MSNSDKLCSTQQTDKQTVEMFSPKQDLDTQSLKNMYSNPATFQSTIILLPSPMDDKLVFGQGYIGTTFVVGVKHHAHTNAAGECSSFLSGPQKNVKK